jgi:hypothetical protein
MRTDGLERLHFEIGWDAAILKGVLVLCKKYHIISVGVKSKLSTV